MTRKLSKIFIKYCEKGDFENAKSLLDEYPEINVHLYQNAAFKNCCCNGHLEMAKWLFNKFPKINIDVKRSCFIEDEDEDDYYDKNKNDDDDDDNFDYNGYFNPFVECCRNGNIEMAKWLKENFINIRKNSDLSKKSFLHMEELPHNYESMIIIDYDEAVGNDKLLNEYFYKNNERCIDDALLYSCQNGHLEITKWLLDIYPGISNSSLNQKNLFISSCMMGYFEFIKWLLEKYPTIDVYDHFVDFGENKYNAFTESCKNGHLEIAIFLQSLDHNKKIDEYKNIAFFNCCQNGKLEVAQWLLSNYPSINIDYTIKKHWNEYNTFVECCQYGHMEMAVWLQSLNKNITFDEYKEKAFIKSCKNGHLNIAMWLLDKFPTLDVHSNKEEAFRKSCEYGYLNVAKWLKDKYTTINVHTDNNGYDIAIVKSCSNGHKEIVEWLIDIDPEITDYIKIEAFNYSCTSGNIEIAKLLLNRYPTINIRANDDSLFFHTVRYRQKKAFKFLSELCDDYKFEYKEKKITGCYIFKNGKKYCKTCNIYYDIKHCCKCHDIGSVFAKCPDNISGCRVVHRKQCPHCKD
jgi:ankyrin repeat protein